MDAVIRRLLVPTARAVTFLSCACRTCVHSRVSMLQTRTVVSQEAENRNWSQQASEVMLPSCPWSCCTREGFVVPDSAHTKMFPSVEAENSLAFTTSKAVTPPLCPDRKPTQASVLAAILSHDQMRMFLSAEPEYTREPPVARHRMLSSCPSRTAIHRTVCTSHTRTVVSHDPLNRSPSSFTAARQVTMRSWPVKVSVRPHPRRSHTGCTTLPLGRTTHGNSTFISLGASSQTKTLSSARSLNTGASCSGTPRSAPLVSSRANWALHKRLISAVQCALKSIRMHAFFTPL
mmetsp:Transcript_31240/g.71916  ORF Transcript_31240/g.71916 Transcript_31240/m.71916 type:complete len:290 (-) Transcript_31240:495-1364(-)